MTCVIVYKDNPSDKMVMVADSEITGGGMRDTSTTGKIISFRSSGFEFLIGVAGSVRILNIIRNMKFPNYKPANAGEVESFFYHYVLTPIRKQVDEDNMFIKEPDAEEFSMVDETGFLFAGQGHIFYVEPNFSYFEPARGMTAIGNGAPVAIGVMEFAREHTPTLHNAFVAVEAIRIASQVCTSINTEILSKSVSLKFKKGKK
jgi:ATP-dependent protease HslVU (ClpYQ) peptidase subunit